ncbi:uncharacterized protein LOC106070910 [Biomphalaria glabrata]|uniref:Uncharacterized protein LOC106070910 n=1 Tax=Biomphalaria glabrata TaxID=6526 RepID=A0A9U8EGM8_BIOGL|nr:uncharacterized protein LOC106070910 [Biomphalaria glabrata]
MRLSLFISTDISNMDPLFGLNVIGNHETQESEGGEADLHRHRQHCPKNPSHSQFIPVDKFTLNDLPVGHRDLDLYDLIKATRDLTIRVAVEMTSPNRPELWPHTQSAYPFYHDRETTKLRTGSGMMGRVYKFTDGVDQDGDEHVVDYTKCWCSRCENSGSPSKVWYEVSINTATHVVFDVVEATRTSFRLFYDREDSPVVTLNKVKVVDVSIEHDSCELKCVTCDERLGLKLKALWAHYDVVWKKVFNRFFKSREKDKLTFIVSHPHGCSKQISVGHWIAKHKVGGYNKFHYTTCTCPGSSGAFVQCVGYSGGRWRFDQLVHSGSSETNYSSAASVL